MKVFALLQISFETSGIYSPSSNQAHSFNWHHLFYFSILAASVFTSAAFFALDAKTIGEYADSFYATETSLVLFIIYAEIVRNTANIFKLIDKYEIAIESRELIFDDLFSFFTKK